MKLLDYTLKLKDLKEVLKMSQPELHGYLYSTVQHHFGKKKVHVKSGSYIYAQGDIPVVLLAHMDTVHSVLPTDDSIFFDTDKLAMWCPDGIGADCRAGVFNILDILAKGYKPHVIFTWDEEIGGVGASEFVKDFPESNPTMSDYLEKNVNFAVQFDRHGFSEAVYYELDSLPFEEYINSFGYKTEIGSYTDICEVCPSYGFAGVNVAAGYTDEHTSNEVLWINEMHNSNKKVIEMLVDQMSNPKHFEYNAFSYGGKWGSSAYGWGSAHGYSDPKAMKYCKSCYSPKDLLDWDEVDDVVLNDHCNLCRAVLVQQQEEQEERLSKSPEAPLELFCEVCGGTIKEDDESYLIGEESYYCSRDCFEKHD